MQIGSFRWENGSVVGPAAYMAERFDAVVEEIKAGRNAVFSSPFASSNVAVRLLVAVQTDYAAWKGQREMVARLGGGRS